MAKLPGSSIAKSHDTLGLEAMNRQLAMQRLKHADRVIAEASLRKRKLMWLAARMEAEGQDTTCAQQIIRATTRSLLLCYQARRMVLDGIVAHDLSLRGANSPAELPSNP
jgi:hypothetical protein